MGARQHLLATACSAVLAFLTLASGSGQTSHVPNANDLLGRHVFVSSFDGQPVDSVVRRVFVDAGVPAVAAILKGCAPAPEPRVAAASGSTLREALEAILKADPRYHWEVNKGVVNLIPSGKIPSLLGVHIQSFDSKGATTPTWALELLLRLPAVQRAEAKLGFVQVPNQIQRGMRSEPPSGVTVKKLKPLHVHCENVTVLQALNAIIRANGGGVWVYDGWYCNGKGGFNVTFSAVGTDRP